MRRRVTRSLDSGGKREQTKLYNTSGAEILGRIYVPLERVAASAPVRPILSRSLDSAFWEQNARNWALIGRSGRKGDTKAVGESCRHFFRT